MNKKFTLGFLITALFDSIWSIANAYVISGILNMVIDMVQQGGTELNDLYPYFGFLLELNAVFSAINFTKWYYRRGLVLKYRTPKFLAATIRDWNIWEFRHLKGQT